MKKSIFILLIGFGFILNSITLDQILENNYKAYGGKEKLASIKNIYTEGKIIQNQMEMPVSIWYTTDGKFRMNMKVLQQKIIIAYDGKNPWWVMPLLGINEPQIIPENQREQFFSQMDDNSDVNILFNYKKKGFKLELLGEADIDGTKVYKLKLSKENKPDTFIYLDKETFVQVKLEVWKKKGDVDIHIETYPGEYKKVDGILVPFNTEIMINGNPGTSVILSKIEFNKNIDDRIFDMNKQEL